MFRKIVNLFCLLLLLSCSSEIDQMFQGSWSDEKCPMAVFQVSIEECEFPTTKVYADNNMKVLWNEGDEISIFNRKTSNSEYMFLGEDGDTGGDFEVISSSGAGLSLPYVYAVYPYSVDNSISSEGIISLSFAAEQIYKDKSFGIGANAMVAVTERNRFSFKNVGGYLSLRLYGNNIWISKVTIRGNNGEILSGKASVSIPLNGFPSVSIASTGDKSVSVLCDPAVKLGNNSSDYTDFWFVLPPVTFTKGFTITVTDVMGVTYEKSTFDSLTVARNQLEWMQPLKVTPNYDNVYVTFADNNFKEYCLNNFDNNDDGKLSFSEARTVTSIDVNTSNVASLQGIECFTALRRLKCCGNQDDEGLLSNLDVSKNLGLAYLDCSFNKIASLDVSKNLALQYLFCSNNELTSLDVSRNAELTSLSCRYNQLSSIVISKQAALTKLYCDNNQLKDLDIGRKEALTDLWCDNNQLVSLDVGDAPSLGWLQCGYNNLQSLNVRNDTSLTKLYCYYNQLTTLNIHNTPSLTTCYCYSNQLTGIDVSECIALEDLSCFSNNLTTLDVSGNTALTRLLCGTNPFLTEIWLKAGQVIPSFSYDSDVATIKYKE